MLSGSPVTLALIAVNVAVSLRAFREFTGGRAPQGYVLEPWQVVRGRNLRGLLLSQFSHADWGHLFFNMFTLYFFGPLVEGELGPLRMGELYFLSEVGAVLLTLERHRHDPGYRALGASGAISGILFAAIVLAPTMGVYVLFIPIAIPAPLFAVAYIAFSVVGARRRLGNVGHEAHIGGARTGFLLAAGMAPDGLRRLFDAVHRLLG